MTKPALRPRLTQKQIRFIREYAIHGNGAEAVRKAGYSQAATVVCQQAYENLRKPQVKAELERRTPWSRRISRRAGAAPPRRDRPRGPERWAVRPGRSR